MGFSFIDLIFPKNDEQQTPQSSTEEKYEMPPLFMFPKIEKVFIESEQKWNEEAKIMKEKIQKQNKTNNWNKDNELMKYDKQIKQKMNQSFNNAREFVTEQYHEELLYCSKKYWSFEELYDQCSDHAYGNVDSKRQVVRNMFMEDIEEAKKIF